jgi:hypothetical protein
MVESKAPVRRRRLGAHGMMFRRRRIFASLREGFTYDEIAADEGVSPSRREGAGEFGRPAGARRASVYPWPRLSPQPESDWHRWVLYRYVDADVRTRRC